MQQKMDQPIYTHHRPHGRRGRFIKSSYNNKPPCLLLPTADENQKPKWTSRGTKKLYITGVWNQKGVQNSQRVNSAKMDKPPVNFRQFITYLSFQLQLSKDLNLKEFNIDCCWSRFLFIKHDSCASRIFKWKGGSNPLTLKFSLAFINEFEYRCRRQLGTI